MSRPATAVPEQLLRRAERQAGLLSMAQCLSGGMTPRQVTRRAESKVWDRIVRGVYDVGLPAPDSLSDRLDRRRRRAATLGPLAYAGGVAVGLGALVLHGVQGTPTEIPAEVAVAKARPRERAEGSGAVRIRRILVPEPVDLDGIPSMPLVQALSVAVPAMDRRDAVAVIDSVAHLGLLDDDGLRRARSATVGRRGAVASGPWWSLADRRSESPAESWARLSCVDAGCPPDALQLQVVVRGRCYRLDMAWVLPGDGLLMVEIDGREVHGAMTALVDDRDRQNRLVTSRTILRRFSGRDARTGVVGQEVSSFLRTVDWRSRAVPEGLAYDIERAEFFLKRSV